MPKKLPDMSPSSGLGDIDDILHNQSVSDLSWLDVDEEEYRKFEALPKQNLDIIPEMSRALLEDERDPRVPMRIPLRQVPIVNSNPLERSSPPVRSSISSVRNRVAAYVMAGMGDSQIRERLLSEFDPAALRASGEESLEVLRERGVLGNVYVNAAHFPRCAQDGPHRAFVANKCPRALFVLSKPECVGCVHNQGGRCASLKKTIVDQVPYDERTYAHYLPQLQSERRASAADAPSSGSLPMSDQERKENLRDAFSRTPVPRRETAPQTIQHRAPPAKPQITEKDIQDFWRRRSAGDGAEPVPSPIYMMAARRIMLGTADARSLVASSDPEVRKLAFEYGIIGHTYLDADALGGPREALDLIRSRSLTPDFVLMRKAYSDPRSAEALVHLSKVTSVVQKRPGIGKESFVQACNRAHGEGRMTEEQMSSAIRNAPDGSDWARLTSQANLFALRRPEPAVAASPAPRGSFHHGDTSRGSAPSKMDAGEVRRAISHMMNTGLSGKALRSAVLARYARADLAQVPEVGTSLSADDGVQGSYFIDPTAYRDFGKGCSEGAKRFRKQGAPHVLAGSSCTGCRLQTAPGWCSKYAKRLIRSVPDEVRREAAERRHLPLAPSNDAPITNPVEEWGLTAELTVEASAKRPEGPELTISSPELPS